MFERHCAVCTLLPRSVLPGLRYCPRLIICRADGPWQKAVNMVNPIGTKGHLAAAFAAILHDMWKQDQTYLVPTQFRVSVFHSY
jgi:hypothetical protein